MTVYGVIIYDSACARNIFLSPSRQKVEKTGRMYYIESNMRGRALARDRRPPPTQEKIMLTDAEIADTHHITRENVRQHRSRAKRRLRKLLGEEDPS